MLHARDDYDRIQDPENKIPLNEPVFLIRGQDRAGPWAVIAWAIIARLVGADMDIISKAMDHAKLMWEYQDSCQNKVPDLLKRK